MEAFLAFVAANAVLVAVLTALVLLGAWYTAHQGMRLWVRDFWVTFPVIGVIARKSKDLTRGANGWLRAEQDLCGRYMPFIHRLTPDQFGNYIEYLRKAGDLGRTPTPMWALALLVVLVIAEGLGFSYMLGTWMAREASANLHTILMVGIVFTMCVILVALTHFAGHQFYRTSLLRSCFARFKEQGAQEYATSSVSLDSRNGAQLQSVDDNQPDYRQILNRVAKHSHDKGSYAGSWVALVLVVLIAVGSTGMRMYAMERDATVETMGHSTPAAASGNPFASPSALPAEVSQSHAEAEAKAQADAGSALKTEGLFAFLVLAVIFVFTQLVGGGVGYLYGFAGRESKKAFQNTYGFATYDEYVRYVSPLLDLASGRLKTLQQRLEQNSHTKLELTKSFDDFMLEQRYKSLTSSGVDLTPAPAPAPVVPPAPAPAPASQGHDGTLAGVQAAMERLNDPVAEKALFQTLPAALAQSPELRQWLVARKQGREAQALLAPVMAEFERLNNAEAEKAYFQTLPAELANDPQLRSWLTERKAQRARQADAEALF